MKSAVVLLPGLNRDRDMIAALTKISGKAPVTVWQTETEIPDVDLIVIPGGFSYRRLPALRRHRGALAGHAGGGGEGRQGRPGASASATASRSWSRPACCPAR